MPSSPAAPAPRTTVPVELHGCWRRDWIEFADGTRDDTSVVVWLQLESDMADVRLPGRRGSVTGRAGYGDCSLDELRALADSESSSGVTVCSAVAAGTDGVRSATAKWIDGPHAVAFQPVSAFPEPGLLEWVTDDVLIERAPSGAYVEEWHRLAGTTHPLQHLIGHDGSHVYRAGDAAVLVHERRPPLPRIARLDELVAECGDDRDRLVSLVDCEFSFARRRDGAFVVEASTLPWREGAVVDVDLR